MTHDKMSSLFITAGPMGAEFDQIVPGLQADLESSGLPPCEGAVNLAGENLMHPLRW